MSVPPTPEYVTRIQAVMDANNLIYSYINVDTLKIVKVPNSECLGRFTGMRTSRQLVRWCVDNIHRDPISNWESVETPQLFEEQSLERVMQVVQALWARVGELENENNELREEVCTQYQRIK
jgi:ribosomal protein S3AE